MTLTQERPATQRPPGLLGRLGGLAEVQWAAAALVLFALGGGAQLAGAPPWVWWMLYLGCYLTGGWEPTLAGIRALRSRSLDVDLLMIVAAVAAASIGQVFDGALLIVIFATSGALESVVTARTADSVRALLELAPERAVLLRGDGGEVVVDASALAVGDIVLVRPGERIGADGQVVEGLSEVDQASITGEPLPVLKGPGAEVFAGTVNGTGALQVRVVRAATDSVVARIVAMVEHASASKARTQLFIEKVEQRYSMAVVTATLALFGVPMLYGAAFEPTLLRAMTFMIVASPCAVVLATMPPLLSTIANAGRHGVLVKSAVVTEKLGHTTLVAFDKTGTLTEGAPRVSVIDVLPAAGITLGEVLQFAAAAERSSEHPIARAVTAAASERSLVVPPACGFSSTPGCGVVATVSGRRVDVGSPALLTRDAAADDEATRQAEDRVGRLEETGATAVVVQCDDVPVAVLGLVDRVRVDARGAVAALAELTGHQPILLTGDNVLAATRLASEVGITEVRAGLLPEDKVLAVADLEAAGHRMLLVGDGVNDAPAMAAAHLGIAMGRRGSDLALETADAIIVRDELTTLAAVITLSRRARRVVRANLAFAAAVIVVLVCWDIVATLPLPIGVAGHESSTVVVALNGLRLLRAAAWCRAGNQMEPPHSDDTTR